MVAPFTERPVAERNALCFGERGVSFVLYQPSVKTLCNTRSPGLELSLPYAIHSARFEMDTELEGNLDYFVLGLYAAGAERMHALRWIRAQGDDATTLSLTIRPTLPRGMAILIC